MRHFTLYTLLLHAFALQLSAQLTISEFLTENRSGLTDEDGDHADWIELSNTTDSAVNLAGWHLTDNSSNFTRWTFPSVEVPPSGRLIIFASGKDRATNDSELHANFSLDSKGEYLALIQPDGATIAKEFHYPEQLEDISYGVSVNVITESIVSTSSSSQWILPEGPIAGWNEASFEDDSWNIGSLGIGFDTSSDYDPFFETDVRSEMRGSQTSVYIRAPFQIDQPTDILGIQFKINYDDGFVAWINGEKIASANAPTLLFWDSRATSSHRDSDAIQKISFPIDQGTSSLIKGENVLAIQGLNRSLSNSDLLIAPELIISRLDPAAPEKVGYFLNPSPKQPNNDIFSGFVSDTKFSTNRGFFSEPFTVQISTKTPDAIVRYTTNGSEPSSTNGTVYESEIQITKTTTLRAIAFKEDFHPTNIDTQTYIFASDVKNQLKMDRDVIRNPAYSDSIEEDLTTNLPAISLIVEEDSFFGPFGIHTNPEQSGKNSEIAVSVEFFNPDEPTGAFQIDGGIRIHGGNARDHPKKPLRLYFRQEYGSRRLIYPLFKDSSVSSFDQLILRSGGHDSWSLADSFGRDESLDLPPHGTIMRDQFLRKTELDMGILSPRGRYVHLYINTQYWGIYDLHERPNAAFFESHLGGNEGDYDVLHHPTFFEEDYTVIDGDSVAWETLLNIVADGVESANEYESIQRFIDIDNFVDHLIVRMWSGDYDWCGPITRKGANVTVFDSKNWYVGRRSRGDRGPFYFFSWDAEMSIGNHLMVNLPQFAIPAQGITDFDLTGVADRGSPAELYSQLRSYTPFQIRFGDRLQKHLFNNGALATQSNTDRWDSMAGELRDAMVAESARWGDEGTSLPIPFTRNDDWQPEISWVRNTFISERNQILLNQFRARDLFPNTDAPTFNQLGGAVPNGFSLSMSSEDTEIYFTTDGSDPYQPTPDELFTLVTDFADVEALIPSFDNGGADIGIEWRTVLAPENIQEWIKGEPAIGYERSGTNYRPLINLDVDDMANVTSSVLVRIPFSIENDLDTESLNKLKLSMKYDDGFVAYLNGSRVASSNAPAAIEWDSASTTNRPDSQAVMFEEFDISDFIDSLVVGDNMLAIQVLNDTPQSSDLLCIPKLTASSSPLEDSISPNAILYTEALLLDESTVIKSRAVNSANGEWSALTEGTFLVGHLASKSNLVISEFNYRPRPPSGADEIAAANGRTDFEFIELTNIGDTEIDLTGVRFAQGIEFTFNLSTSITKLSAGQQLLIVEDTDAMQSRYGAAVLERIAGEFENGTKLSNNGESITLLAADDSIIQSLTYSDQDPWPPGADGEGFTLTLINSGTNPNPSSAESWTISTRPDGSPAGTTLSTTNYNLWRTENFDPASPSFAEASAPESDPDRNGFNNAIEYAFGTNPNLSRDQPNIDVTAVRLNGENYLAITFVAAVAGNDVSIIGEVSNNLKSWQNSTVLTHTKLSSDFTKKEITLRSIEPINSGKTQQIRLRVNLNALDQ